MTDWLFLTAWRLRHGRFRCLLGLHRWEGAEIPYASRRLEGADELQYCTDCPTDRTFISAGFPAYVAYWQKYATPRGKS